jgi:spermidine/putrescine ABC transporter ATP-binding subunit
MAEIAVRLEAITKRFDRVVAVHSLSLEVFRGEFLSLLGPSGCGKTTTLRMIAGFVEPDTGSITIMGEEMTDRPPYKRNLGMVFQSYALFPHMTVFDNVAFGLKMRGMRGIPREERVKQALGLVQLSEMSQRYPRQLSGGQQQRVALARALVIEPYVLLLDEPLSNLDAKLRKSMQKELRDLQQRLGITAIYVTHDQEEAMTLSDRIVVMNQGRIMQIGTPTEIYRQPANDFVANFIGNINLLRGRLKQWNGRWYFHTDRGVSVPLPSALVSAQEATMVDLAIRPEMLQLCPDNQNQLDEPGIVARVVRVVYTGALTSYEVELAAGQRLLVEEQNTLGVPQWHVGDQVQVTITPETLYFVPVTRHNEL